MTDEEYSRAARYAEAHYSSEDIQIDSGDASKFSEADDAVWVQAWVRAPKEHYV